MNAPSLFDNIPEPPTPYVAGSDTSRERAIKEDTTGIATERRQTILALLTQAPDGLTWREISHRLGWHHGQVSSALCVLHKQGKIAMLTAKRDKCHPYVHPAFFQAHADELIMEPAQTRAGRKNEAINDVLEAARAFCQTGLGAGAIRDALRVLDSLDE